MDTLIKRITRIVILATLGAWLVWDIIAYNLSGKKGTISDAIATGTCDWMPLIYIVVFCAGHFLWPHRVKV